MSYRFKQILNVVMLLCDYGNYKHDWDLKIRFNKKSGFCTVTLGYDDYSESFNVPLSKLNIL